jgi:hypothetical protein
MNSRVLALNATNLQSHVLDNLAAPANHFKAILLDGFVPIANFPTETFLPSLTVHFCPQSARLSASIQSVSELYRFSIGASPLFMLLPLADCRTSRMLSP